MMEDFLVKGPFGADINPKDALAYIANMKEIIAKMRENEEQLRKDLAIFGLSLPDCEELTRLEKVCLLFSRMRTSYFREFSIFEFYTS